MLYNRRRLLLTPAERQGMREACRFNAQLMDEVRKIIAPGVTTGQIDKLVETYTRDHGHVPAQLGYHGQAGAFPASCCTSVNDVICHGIPGDYVLKDGDIVNVDLTTIVNGWHGDSSETFIIGTPPDLARRVVQCAFECLWLAIDNLKPNCRVSDIGDPIVRHAKKQGFSVVEEYVENTALGRAGTPEDIAGAVLYLCSPASSWLTGEVLDLNGGAHLKRYPDVLGHVMKLAEAQ